jgi:hypothetical protein
VPHLYIDNSAELLEAIHLLEAAACKVEQAALRPPPGGGLADVHMLEAEATRLRRELAHYRRLFAAEVAAHLRC